jgi:hypothetical protein
MKMLNLVCFLLVSCLAEAKSLHTINTFSLTTSDDQAVSGVGVVADIFYEANVIDYFSTARTCLPRDNGGFECSNPQPGVIRSNFLILPGMTSSFGNTKMFFTKDDGMALIKMDSDNIMPLYKEAAIMGVNLILGKKCADCDGKQEVVGVFCKFDHYMESDQSVLGVMCKPQGLDRSYFAFRLKNGTIRQIKVRYKSGDEWDNTVVVGSTKTKSGAPIRLGLDASQAQLDEIMTNSLAIRLRRDPSNQDCPSKYKNDEDVYWGENAYCSVQFMNDEMGIPLFVQ